MKTIIAHYDKDTFRTHRYMIAEGQEITGSIYIPKELKGEDIPREFVIKLEIKD